MYFKHMRLRVGMKVYAKKINSIWGESFYLELTQDIKDGFARLEKSKK